MFDFFFLHLFPIEHSQDGCISFKETPLPRCLNVFAIVMYALERSHDSDPTPAIFSPISTMENSEPLVLLGSRSHSETSGVVCNRPKSYGVARRRPGSCGVIRSRPESCGVLRSWSRAESTGVGVVRSRPVSIGVNWSRPEQCACYKAFHFVVLFCLSLCVCISITSLCCAGRLRKTPTPTDSKRHRLRATPDDSEQL